MIKIEDNKALVVLGVDDIDIGHGKVSEELKTYVFVIKTDEGNSVEIYANNLEHVEFIISGLQNMLSDMKNEI